MKKLFAEVDDHVKRYEQETITLADDIEFSTWQRIKTTAHYILSKYTDKRNADQPFQNIGNAVVDIEFRAKNIDRKGIEAQAKDGDYLFSMIVNKELAQWMQDNGFGATIDNYQRKKSEYGSALLKTTEKKDELKIDTVNWTSVAVDQHDITGGMKVEEDYISPLNLQKMKGVWMDEGIESALQAHKKRSSLSEFKIKLLDVEGEFTYDMAFEDEEVDEKYADKIGLFNFIIAVVGEKKFLLHRAELKQSRYDHDARKQVEGRDLGMGVWEEVTEPQMAINEAVIAEKEAMEIGGKVVIKTNKKGLPSAMSLVNGEMIELAEGEFFEPVNLVNAAIPQFGNQIDRWFLNMQRDQSAFPGMSGEQPKASTPGISLQLQAAQSGSIFNKRRDQDGFFLIDKIILNRVLPFLVKKINREHVLCASYSKTELEQLDRAIREYLADKQIREDILDGREATPELKSAYENIFQEELNKQGSSRTLKIPAGFITMDKIKKKCRFDITDEMSDSQRKLNALATALAQLPAGDPQRTSIIQEMMEITGVSPASFPVTVSATTTNTVPKQTRSSVNSVLPEAQQV